MERLEQQRQALETPFTKKTSKEKPHDDKSVKDQYDKVALIEPPNPDLNLMLGELNKPKQQPALKNKQNAYWGAAVSEEDDGFNDDFDKIADIPISEDPQSQRIIQQNDSIDSFEQVQISFEADPVIKINQPKA